MRLELLPPLIRRQQEELILEQVPIDDDWLDDRRQSFWVIRLLMRF